MVENDQGRPLAPAVDRPSSDDEATHHQCRKQIRRRKFKRCCGCMATILLVLAMVIIILIFTVFKVKEPEMKMNGVIVTKLELINSTIPKTGSVNVSIVADVSVKNPNVASFRYSNTTTGLYYHGLLVGEARGPPGKAKARRTMRMNITVDIITGRLLSNPSLLADVNSGLLTMSSYSRIPGRVKMLGMIGKHVTVKMSCTFTFNISSSSIQEQTCKRKVKL